MNIKYLFIIILYLIFILPQIIVGNEEDISSSDDEEEGSSEPILDWVVDEEKVVAVDNDEFPTPTKITNQEQLKNNCKRRHSTCDKSRLRFPNQDLALTDVSRIAIQGAIKFNQDAPDNFLQTLAKEHNQCLPAGYAKGPTGLHTETKVGETGCWKRRRGEQAESLNFLLSTPPDEWLDNGFVHTQMYNDIMEYIKKLPMTGGVHEDNYDKIGAKFVRQLGENNMSCAYDVRDGVTMEWVLRCPSKREAELVNFSKMIETTTTVKSGIEAVVGQRPINNVLHILTWPKMDDYLREPEFDKLSLFLHPRKYSVSEYLLKRNIEEAMQLKFRNVQPTCPYYTMIKPTVDKIKQVIK